MYVLVRTDLAPSLRAVHVAHACLEAGALYGAPPGHNIVLCGVEDEVALLTEVNRIRKNDLRIRLFYEPDGAVGYTAACSEAVSGAQRALFRDWRLLV